MTYSGWRKWISDPDLTVCRMKSNVNGLLWVISRSSARSKVKSRQNSNSAMLNDGGRRLNIVTDQYTAKNVNNCHPRPVPTTLTCLIPSMKMKISFDIHVILQWLQRSHAVNSGDAGGKSATSVQSECAPTTSRGQAVKLRTFCSPPIIRICQWEHGLRPKARERQAGRDRKWFQISILRQSEPRRLPCLAPNEDYHQYTVMLWSQPETL